MTPVGYKVRQFCFGLFLYSPVFQKPKHLFKECTVEAAKLFKVASHRNPPSKDSLVKMQLHAKLTFLHTLFLEKEAQIDQNNYRMLLFMSNQVSLPKISSILQKMKTGPKTDIYALISQRPSNAKNNAIQCLLFD